MYSQLLFGLALVIIAIYLGFLVSIYLDLNTKTATWSTFRKAFGRLKRGLVLLRVAHALRGHRLQRELGDGGDLRQRLHLLRGEGLEG